MPEPRTGTREESQEAREERLRLGYYGILDRAPKGRDEGAPGTEHRVRRHDEYAEAT
jgi:predicted dithiol-disulfide oxidoreductase (DUF899 family)